MTLIPKYAVTKEDVKEIKKGLTKGKSKGGFDAKKYNGLIPSLEDVMVIQKRMRDEWDRAIDL